MKLRCPNDPTHQPFRDDRLGLIGPSVPHFAPEGTTFTGRIPETLAAMIGDGFAPVCMICGATAIFEPAKTR